MEEALKSLLENYLNSGNLLAYAVVFVGGILISFTPCVYPIIPITVGYIGGRAAGKKWHGFTLSLFYVLGMAIVYSAMGAIASLTGRLFGQISSSPIAFFVVGNICILLALSMLDVFYLPMPAFLSKIQPKGRAGGFIGSVMVGMASGLVVGPCTAPVLGVLFTYVYTRQNVIFGVSLMFFFALGMGVLLIVLGTFSALLGSLPKAGKWMNTVKKVFGFILIGVGEYFLIQMGKALI